MKHFDYTNEETLDWFSTYQTLPYEGEPKHWRDKDDSRLEKFLKSDFCNKYVLDIGCNVGGVMHYLKRDKTVVCHGIDCMADTVALARKINDHYKQDIKFQVADILHEDFIEKIKTRFERETFDTVLFLSVYHSISRKTRLLDPEETKRIWEHLDKVTGEILYFEGHGNETEQQYRDLFNKYLPTYTINFLGMNNDYQNERYPGRPFFRLVKHRYYDIKNPLFKPGDIWKRPSGLKNVKKEDIPLDMVENYNLCKNDKGMNILKLRIDNGEVIHPPILNYCNGKYLIFDGIHRSCLYFHMFKDEIELPCIINPIKIE